MAKSAGGSGKRGETHYNRKETGKKPNPKSNFSRRADSEPRSYRKPTEGRPDASQGRNNDKPFRREDRDGKPFSGKRFEGNDSSRKPYSRKSEGGDFEARKQEGHKPFRREEGDRKPFSGKRFEGNDSSRKPYSRKSEGGDFEARKQEGHKQFRREDRDGKPFSGKRFEEKDSSRKASGKRYGKEGFRGEQEGHERTSKAKTSFPRKGEDEHFEPRKTPNKSKPFGQSKQAGFRQNAAKKKSHFEPEEFAENSNPGKPGKWNTVVKSGPMTLNKYLAHSGVSSRRDAAAIIKEGRVKVNGALLNEPGYRVQPNDKVTLDGKSLQPQKQFVYVLLNKPKDFITTTEDDKGRRTVMELVASATDDRLYPVGRLDRNTTGVLLLTNDGDLAQKLSHPKYEHKKIYQVSLNKDLTKRDFDQILEGITLEDGLATVDRLAILDKKNEVGLEIHSGRNRIVRRIFEHLGYEVEKLDRVMYAGLTKKNVSRGQWRFLTEKEVIALKHFRS